MRTALAACILSLPVCAGPVSGAASESLQDLGEALFFDMNLSKNRTQACATCHDPNAGFADPRGTAVSLGDDGTSQGTRNAPTASYAAFSPVFHKTEGGMYKGGQFLDGREKDLAGQAGGPPLNPVEMAMPNKAAVVARLRENPAYVAAFAHLFEATVLNDDATAFVAMTQAIAAFEQSDTFAPFDSRFDRFLREEVELTELEIFGGHIFFMPRTNCNICHQLHLRPAEFGETFSNYEFHNIGTPANPALGDIPPDRGLGAVLDDPAQDGKFKVPTLRNVAVTAPYMHNGVFDDLRTVVEFYEKYTNPEGRAINPETGQPWGAPEVAANISWPELENARPLNDLQIDALVAFMKTLTDARYEHLLD